MELRQLRYFVAVAETGHFGRAAERLHRSQPPVSLQIQRLETELGVKLFERTTRQVTLTEAGYVFLEKAQAIMQQVEAAKEAVGEAALGHRGHLSVGFISSAMLSVLPMALMQFRVDYPGVKLELRELTSAEQRIALIEKTIRVGLVRLPLLAPELQFEPVLEESLLVTLPKGHALEGEVQVTPQMLAPYPLISFPPQLVPGAHAHLMALFERAGVTPQVTQEAVHMQTIVSLVASGIGISVLPGSARASQHQGVVYRPFAAEGSETWLGLAWLKGETSLLVTNFASSVRASVKEYKELELDNLPAS